MLRFLQNKKEFVQSSSKKIILLLKVKKFFVYFALDMSNKNRVMS